MLNEDDREKKEHTEQFCFVLLSVFFFFSKLKFIQHLRSFCDDTNHGNGECGVFIYELKLLEALSLYIRHTFPQGTSRRLLIHSDLM